jgi:chromosome segregation ATPase
MNLLATILLTTAQFDPTSLVGETIDLRTFREAVDIAALEEQHSIRVGTVTYEYSNSVPRGTILAANQLANQLQPANTEVPKMLSEQVADLEDELDRAADRTAELEQEVSRLKEIIDNLAKLATY